jgi:hypothetical protein
LPLIQEIFVYHEGNELRRGGAKAEGRSNGKSGFQQEEHEWVKTKENAIFTMKDMMSMKENP